MDIVIQDDMVYDGFIVHTFEVCAYGKVTYAD
jgi:hypothetical protein